MIKKNLILSLILLLITLDVSAGVLNKKDSWFVFWGYNRATYTDSNIHFKADTYDYTLYDVKASDRPSRFDSTYFEDITIPQYVFQVGYFIDDRQAFSFAFDHMKYVVDVPQLTKINGVDHQANAHSNDNIELDGFLAFEHTDGLNYLNVSYEYSYPLWQNPSQEHAVSLLLGAGTGLLVHKSNVSLLGHSKRNDEYKIAGYGMDLHIGLTFDFLSRYFVRLETKMGHINMSHISTSSSSSDKARQNFNFSKHAMAVGLRF